MICLSSKTKCCFDSQANKFKISSNSLNERPLEDSGDGPMPKYCKVLEEIFNITSTKEIFRTIQHTVATNEQTKK